MKLELHLDGETKIYTISHATARHFRTLMEHDQKIDYNDLSTNDVDVLVGFVCDVFRNQFTIDEFYDGIKSNELLSKILEVSIFVRTGKDPAEIKVDKVGKRTGEVTDPKKIRASMIKNAKEMLNRTKGMYRDRLKDGWTLGQIDEMDIHFYFSLFNEESEKVYIDEIRLF